jgi:hypothetical protein
VARSRMKSLGIWSARVLLSLVILFALAIGFGTSGTDAEKMRVFAEAVERWQHNPDFREVQVEYVEMGNEAMRTRACFVDTTEGIMWLRSLPGLPEHLRVNDTSLAHYRDFCKGPLSAYMHLTAEQGLGETLKMIKYLGTKEKLTDDDIRDFLHQYKLHNPVASDAGAVASVRSLINDVDPSRGFTIEGDVGAKVTPHIASIAQSMGYPANMERMTPAQQLDVWQVLDDEVRETDYELWRSKQVNDWLNGVWAQVYGTMYSGLIGPTLTLREVGRVAGPVMLMGWVGFGIWKRRREMAAAEEARAVQPRLALEGPKDMSEG